ncbi:MAG TPA: POTRA domain-containing protein [Bryobacteraceae bacterium]|jgi:outer membrane protein assembly factor BamA|nr:POTRA domain-containing protein [Bryobacteraceae bacterium]
MRALPPLVAVYLLARAVAAEPPGAPPAHQPPPPPGVLQSISVKGNRLYSTPEILKTSRLVVGQPVTAAALAEARTRLLSTELFNNVTDAFSYKGSPPAYDLTIEVTENEQVYPVHFERLGVPADALLQYLREHVELYSDRIPGTEGVLKRYTAAIQEFVQKTHPALRVKAQVMPATAEDLTVLFIPDEPLPTISRVIITGNSGIDTGTLLRAINDVAVGVPMTQVRVDQILNGTVKRVYATKGYMAVTFPKIETERSKAVFGDILKIQIKEGPVFQVGAIHFHGSGLDQDEIRSTIPIKPGATFNQDLVDGYRRDLTHRMQRRGYLDVKVDSETQVDDSKRLVNVTYNVGPGPVYSFGKLDIRGLDLISEPQIANLWGEKPGKPFDPDYPDYFVKRIKEQQLFDNLSDITSDYAADPTSHLVTVHIYFKGGKPKDAQKKKDQPYENAPWSPFPPP